MIYMTYGNLVLTFYREHHGAITPLKPLLMRFAPDPV